MTSLETEFKAKYPTLKHLLAFKLEQYNIHYGKVKKAGTNKPEKWLSEDARLIDT